MSSDEDVRNSPVAVRSRSRSVDGLSDRDDGSPVMEKNGNMRSHRHHRHRGSTSRSRSRTHSRSASPDGSRSPIEEDDRDEEPNDREEDLERSRSGSPIVEKERSRSRSRSRSRDRDRDRRSHHRSRSYRSSSRRRRSSRRSRSRSSRRSARRRSRSYSRSPTRRSRRSRSPLPPPRSRAPYHSSYNTASSYYSRYSPRRSRYNDGRDNPEPCACLGVFGMSLNTTERDLKRIFGEYGEIETVQLVYDRYSGRSRGFGFVYFVSTKEAARAKDHLKDAVIDGMRVRVDFSVTKGAPNGRTLSRRSRSRSSDSGGGRCRRSRS